MARYIDADVLKERLEKIKSPSDEIFGMGITRGIERAETTVDMIPTADVVEVKHGKWKLMSTEKFMDGSYSSKFFCSKCLREIGVCHEHESDKHKYAKSMYPYCHCGAKMDGGAE